MLPSSIPAVAAGVRHVVYTSFVAASPESTFTLGRDHYGTEEHIKASGMTYTFLRDNLYLDFAGALVGEDGMIRGPAGDGRLAGVARADVARVATVVLQDPGAHANATYHLTGPEALTMAEVAATLSKFGGRDVGFYDESIGEAYESRRRWNAPDWQVDAWVSTYTAVARGDLADISPDVELVTSRPPISLADFLRGEMT